MSKKEHVIRIKNDIIDHFSEYSNYKGLLCEAFKYVERGQHKKNPYHNLEHCYNVLDLCYIYSQTESEEENLAYYEQVALFLAAIFHDYDHSGKKLSVVNDKKNIKYAINGLMMFKEHLKNTKYSNLITFHKIFDIARRAIRCTMAKIDNGKVYFTIRPKNRVEKILRDADVSGLTTQLGMILSKGFAKEMSMQYNKKFKENQILFLKNVKLYTPEAIERREIYIQYLRENYI